MYTHFSFPAVLRAPFELHQSLLSIHTNKTLLTFQLQLRVFYILARKLHLTIFRGKKKKEPVSETTRLQVFNSVLRDP